MAIPVAAGFGAGANAFRFAGMRNFLPAIGKRIANFFSRSAPAATKSVASPKTVETVFKNGRKYTIPINPTQAVSKAPVTAATSIPALASKEKGFFRKAGEGALLYGALPMVGVDAVTSLLPGAANQIAAQGKIDGQYQLGPSLVKNMMKLANVGYDDTSLNTIRKNILQSELGTKANAYGVDLSALTDSSNPAINFALEEGKRKTFRKEEKRAIDDEHRRNSAIALAQLQNQMDIAGLNQTTALRGIDLQEKRYERESKEDTLKQVLALLALMKAD